MNLDLILNQKILYRCSLFGVVRELTGNVLFFAVAHYKDGLALTRLKILFPERLKAELK